MVAEFCCELQQRRIGQGTEVELRRHLAIGEEAFHLLHLTGGDGTVQSQAGSPVDREIR
jgi:hypothetical protein